MTVPHNQKVPGSSPGGTTEMKRNLSGNRKVFLWAPILTNALKTKAFCIFKQHLNPFL